jgi:hypothetical protein
VVVPVRGGGAVAEGGGDDGRWGLEGELAQRGGPGLRGRGAEGLESVAEGAGGEGLAGSSAVDSQRLSGLAAVFMFVRAVRS